MNQKTEMDKQDDALMSAGIQLKEALELCLQPEEE